MASHLGRDIAAAGLAAAGVGVASWGLLKLYRGKSATLAVSGLTISVGPGLYPLGQVANITITANWVNGSAQQVPYGVQGVVLGHGLVVGHLWTTLAAAVAASQAYAAGQQQQAAADAANPGQRVQLTAVGPGQAGSAALYGDPIIAAGESLLVWVMPNPPSGALLVSDPVGGLGSRMVVAGAGSATANLVASAQRASVQRVAGSGLLARALAVAGTRVRVRKTG